MCMCEKMQSTSRNRRHTAMEQNRLLQNFYDEIYDEERNFTDDNTSQFENETDDVDVDADIDNEDEQQDFTIDGDDPNRDDEPLITQ